MVLGAFIGSRLLYYVAFHYTRPRISSFSPLSLFVERGIYQNLFNFFSSDYDDLCRTGMTYDEQTPIAFFPIDFDEETDSNSQPLLGRYDTSRTLVIVVPPIEIPFVDMAKFDVRDYASTVQDKELPNLRTWYGIPDSITLQAPPGS